MSRAELTLNFVLNRFPIIHLAVSSRGFSTNFKFTKNLLLTINMVNLFLSRTDPIDCCEIITIELNQVTYMKVMEMCSKDPVDLVHIKWPLIQIPPLQNENLPQDEVRCNLSGCCDSDGSAC